MDEKNKSDNTPDWFQNKFHRWFVQYNPLYFFSALCVVFGVFLVSRGMDEKDWVQGEIILTGVIELYEILLLAGAALLFCKARQYRSAVILGVIEIVFLFDCTFQTEIIATFGYTGIILTFLWIAMAGLKLFALTWIFRLKTSVSAFVIPILAAVGIAGFPHILGQANVDKTAIHLIATWFGIGLAGFVILKRPQVKCDIMLDKWGQTVLRRATLSAWMIWAGLYFYHVAIWLKLFDITLTISHIIPFVLLPVFISDTENGVWKGCLAAIAVSLLNPPGFSVTALVVGIVFAIQAWRIREKRLYVGAVISLNVACWTIGWQNWPLPEMNLYLNLATAVILMLMGWRMRLYSAFLSVALGTIAWWIITGPHSLLEWGILFLIIGFIALIAGVIINWRMRPAEVHD
ncbi:MAG: hypothetical protein GY795_34415 [Desulfobacterales bacterium]|nr:hypothetical protein [Desulfobacterales bacterium]